MPSYAILKSLLSRTPLILKRMILRLLGMSAASGKQDMLTEVIEAIIRSHMTFEKSISFQQRASWRDFGVKGPMWVAKTTFPKPEDDVQDAIFQALDDLKTIGDETFIVPHVVPIEAEWTGPRSNVEKGQPLPDISEEEKYKELRKELPGDTVILYFHGGAYW